MFLLTRRHLLSLAAGTAATAFPTARTAAAPQPISEDGFVRVSEIDQWVAIRGRDRLRPAI